MDYLTRAAEWLRAMLAQQPWLDPWQPTIEKIPDWVLLAAVPTLLLFFALILRLAWPRPRLSDADTKKLSSAAQQELQLAPPPPRAESALVAKTAPAPRPPTAQPVAAQPMVTSATVPSATADDDEDNRSVRVFVSSTFLDMQAERDELVIKTFPALRAKYRARGVEVFEVDLRWGITREQQERGETLPTLLAEVDRCRPYFIGLLGDRYGWVPPAVALTDKLKADFPAIAEAQGASITAMEIMHGVLSDPDIAARALFFERDPNWDWRATLNEADRASAGEEPEVARVKLEDLKTQVRQRAGVETYARPEEIGAKVTAALDALLEARFPETDAPDAFEQTARLHRAYARDRRGLHVGAKGYVGNLNRWMDTKDAAPLLIAGASGGGKSTLVANWLHAWRKAHPGDIFFEHYLGASPDSSDPMLIVQRLWEHLNRATGETVAPPGENAELMDMSAALAQRLAQVRLSVERSGARVLIALDGLDKLSSEQNLRWLPIVPGVHWLASSCAGETETAARARGFAPLEVKPLSEQERRDFIADTLARWRRELEPQHVARILQPAAAELAGSPLYLKTVLEELRVSADNARLTERLEDYRAAHDMANLFDRVLKRLEDDCEPGLVAKALPLIWASRAGLEETEILTITGASPLAWATVRNGLGDGLRDQQGRIAFGHDFLNQAVAMRYLNSDEQKRRAHLALADHFEAREPDKRQAEELPYQLRVAEEWERLEALLVDLDRFSLLHANGSADLLSSWLPLKRRGRDPEALLCRTFLTAAGAPSTWHEPRRRLAGELTAFLSFAGLSGDATESLHRNLCEALKCAGADHAATAIAEDNLAGVLAKRSNLRESVQIRTNALRTLSEKLGPTHSTTLKTRCNLANSLLVAGDLEASTFILEDLVDLCTKAFGVSHQQTLSAKSDLASALKIKRRLDRALILETEVLAACRETLGSDHHDTLVSLNNLAATHFMLRDLGKAFALQAEIAEARARLFGNEHPETLIALNNLAETKKAQGDLNSAQTMHEDILKTRIKVFGNKHPSTLMSLNNLAHTLTLQGKFYQALPLQEEVLQGRIRVLGGEHMDTVVAMNNVAVSLVALGELERARPLAQRALEHMTKLLGPNHPDTINAAMGLKLISAMSNE